MTTAKMKALAEKMYINDGDSMAKISELLGVSESTLYRWAQGTEKQLSWQEQKESILTTPHKIKQRIDEEMYKAVSGEAYDKNLGDFLAKAMKARSNIDKSMSLDIYFDVVKELNVFMSNNYPEKMLEMFEINRAFLSEKSKEGK